MVKTYINFGIDKNLLNELQEISNERGWTKSQFIRWAIKNEIEYIMEKKKENNIRGVD